MLTKNIYAFMPTMLIGAGIAKGMVPFKNTNGVEYYFSPSFSYYPYNIYTSYSTSGDPGIWLGRDSTAENEDDYNLHSRITSGLSVTVVSRTLYEENGYSVLDIKLNVANTSSANITIGEIGYFQRAYCAINMHLTSTTTVTFMVDRTVLDPVVDLAAGEATIIDYKLKIIQTPKVVNGVKIVTWQLGTAEDVGNMIDAAHEGDIDLQIDGGWRIGDTRKTTVGEFLAGSDTRAAQTLDIAITSFDEYMNCGNVLQFDFVTAHTGKARMNASNTNIGSYGASEMKMITLPSFANAMETWIKSRLIPFDVLVGAGNSSSEIVTVSDNLLALRSEVEVFGTSSSSCEGEGSWVDYYKRSAEARYKRLGRGGGTNTWRLRSPTKNNSAYFLSSRSGGDYASSSYNASSLDAFAPFGCL